MFPLFKGAATRLQRPRMTRTAALPARRYGRGREPLPRAALRPAEQQRGTNASNPIDILAVRLG